MDYFINVNVEYCEYYICYFTEKGAVGKEVESELPIHD